jgi:hypothetical protein
MIVPSLAIVALLVIAALACGFFDRSWDAQVRWVVTAPMVGFPGQPYPSLTPLDLREVTLGWVRLRDDALELELLDRRADGRASSYVTDAVPAPEALALEALALLDEWCALRTPMVLYVDQAGVGSLTRPVATISGLRPAVVQPQPVRHVMQQETEGP